MSYIIHLQAGATFNDVPEDMKTDIKLVIGDDDNVKVDPNGGRVGKPATDSEKAWAIVVRPRK